MSSAQNPYASFGSTASLAPADERTTFLKKTYMHLAAAIYAFVAIQFAIFKLVDVEPLVQSVLGTRWGWLIVLGAFMAVSWIADSWARSSTSKGLQYAGLFLFVIAEAVIFVPLLYIANEFAAASGKPIIGTAATITLVMFAGLTAAVLLTKKDFSFLGPALTIAGFAAMGFILCGIIFGFSLGIFFTVAMIVFASGYILYDTSNVLHHYRTDQYVAASLSLFASVALLFWYVLRFVMYMYSER